MTNESKLAEAKSRVIVDRPLKGKNLLTGKNIFGAAKWYVLDDNGDWKRNKRAAEKILKELGFTLVSFEKALNAKPAGKKNTEEAELPKGFIEVATGADAFKKVAPYFTDGATFKAVSKGFNREDVFTFEGKNGILLKATCTPDNSRVECVEVLNANESGSKRTPLFVAIKPIIPEPEPEEKTEETAAEEIVEVEANTEVKAEETESRIGDIFKAAVKTLGEEVSESDAKFEIGKTYFVMHFLTHQTDTITVEARTAQMLTGTTTEGTRKFRIFENVRGEFVTIGKDEDGYDIYIYAKNEFTSANVEAGKKAAIETAAQLGINSEPQAETTTDSHAEVKKACKHYSINPDFDDEDRPIKYNHVNIVIEDGRLKIDGLFECLKPETAYNRFRKIMAQAAADVPELKGWDAWEPAKKLTFDDTEKVWLNENGDMIFDTKYAVETLNVDINEDNIYIWGTFYTTAEAYKAAHPEEPASELDVKAEEFKAEVRYVTGCVGAWFANLIDAKAFVEKHEMEHHEDFQYSLIEKSVGYDFETVYVNIAENFKPQGFEPRAIRNEIRNKANEKLPKGFIEVNTGAETDGSEEDSDDQDEVFNLLPEVDELNDTEVGWELYWILEKQKQKALGNYETQIGKARVTFRNHQIVEINENGLIYKNRNGRKMHFLYGDLRSKKDFFDFILWAAAHDLQKEHQAAIKSYVETDGSEEDSEEEFIAVIPTDDSEDDDDELVDPPAESLAEKSDYDISQVLSALY